MIGIGSVIGFSVGFFEGSPSLAQPRFARPASLRSSGLAGLAGLAGQKKKVDPGDTRIVGIELAGKPAEYRQAGFRIFSLQMV